MILLAITNYENGKDNASEGVLMLTNMHYAENK
jgi:hypothetical protein